MAVPIITLTTDFGGASPYVAAMKGVLLARCPEATLVDLSHAIPAQDVVHAAYFLRDALPWFPPGSIHVVVVDPGVGTSRAALHIILDGKHMLCPDNGLWTLIPHVAPPVVRYITAAEYWLNPVSATFHGRDIFAPCAAALANALPADALGPVVADWCTLPVPPCQVQADAIVGEVVFVDDFGNLITNIPAQVVPAEAKSLRLGKAMMSRFVKTYGDAEAGELVVLTSSSGYLEIAEVNGNAARRLDLGRGAAVRIERDALGGIKGVE
jgi:S-adenosylmethionine hydrolase